MIDDISILQLRWVWKLACNQRCIDIWRS